MKSSIPIATTNIVAMLAVLAICPSLDGADRLDDWSSPRPIKYRATETDRVARRTNTGAPGEEDTGSKRDPLFRIAEPMPTDNQELPLVEETQQADSPRRMASRRCVSASGSRVPCIVIPQPAIEMPMEPVVQPMTSPTMSMASPTMSMASSAMPMTSPTMRMDPSLMSVEPTVQPNTDLPTHPSIVDRANDPPSMSLLPANDLGQPTTSEQSVLDRGQMIQRDRLFESASEIEDALPQQELASSQGKLPVPAIETKTVSGWQLGRLAGQKVLEAEDLLSRQSPMSARHHAIEALHLMAQSTDELTHSNEGTQALSQALTAIREASDFLGRYGAVDPAALQRLVDSHSTRVLKRCDLKDVQPLRAADTYYEFARGRFVDAVGGWVVSARALVVVAKTEPVTSDQTDTNLSAAQVCFLRSAVACDPQNAIAANELGHELLALGMFDEARWALEHSYAQKPTAAALQNLAELHRVTGNVQLAQACAANLSKLRDEKTRVARVIQRSPAQFAQVSPQVMTSGSAAGTAVDGGVLQGWNGSGGGGSATTLPRQPSTGSQSSQQQEGRVANTWNRVKQIFR
ncbi:MAG: hypothetical protein R3C05_24835 [Pirellulaceae bacterium]